MSANFSFLLQRPQSAVNTGHADVDSQSSAFRNAHGFPKRQRFIAKPPEPAPSTITRPFGAAPGLRERI
jgi:hypothetical protein